MSFETSALYKAGAQLLLDLSSLPTSLKKGTFQCFLPHHLPQAKAGKACPGRGLVLSLPHSLGKHISLLRSLPSATS
jgi:hypothetical protein